MNTTKQRLCSLLFCCILAASGSFGWAQEMLLHEPFDHQVSVENNELLSTARFNPEPEELSRGQTPEFVIESTADFPVLPKAKAGALRVSSGILICALPEISDSFWMSFQIQRSSTGFCGVNLKGKLTHDLLKIEDTHADAIEGFTISLSGAAPAPPPLSPQPSDISTLCVIHYDANTETAALWINPPTDSEPSLELAYQQTPAPSPDRPAHMRPPFAKIAFWASRGCTALFDEIRIAGSFEDLGLKE